MVKQIIILIFLFLSNLIYGQRVFPKTAKISLTEFNSVAEDGMITFEISVRMSDCLSHIEMNDLDRMKIKKNLWDKIHDWWWFKIRKKFDFEISKTFKLNLHESNYFLSEEGSSEDIFMKCDLITLKSVYGRKSVKKKLQINLYSKSGKLVYSKDFILDKYKLIEKGEVRPGVEPG